MFDFSGLSTKFIATCLAVLAILALVAAGLWYVEHKDKKIEDLTAKNAKADVVIDIQHDTIEKGAKSGKIEEKTNLDVAVAVVENKTKQAAVVKKTEDKVKQIENDFAAKPQAEKTPQAEADEATQISAVRIDGLWNVYCTHNPEKAGCTPSAAPANPAAPDLQLKPSKTLSPAGAVAMEPAVEETAFL